MQKCLLVKTFLLVGFYSLAFSSFVTNFPFFSLGEIFSISKHLKAHPRQMELGMRSLQALQVQASPSICDMSFNNTALPINGCQFQNYLFYA